MGINIHVVDTAKIVVGKFGPQLVEPSWWDSARYAGDRELVAFIGSENLWTWGHHELAYDSLCRPSNIRTVREYVAAQEAYVRERWFPLLEALDLDDGLWMYVT